MVPAATPASFSSQELTLPALGVLSALGRIDGLSRSLLGVIFTADGVIDSPAGGSRS